MLGYIKKTTLFCLFFLVAICSFSTNSHAVVAVQTDVASGRIVEKYDNNAVKLDDGNVYYPSRKDLAIDLQVGAPVTLRYVVQDSDKYVFFTFSPGFNSLEKLKPVDPKDNTLK